MNSGIKQSASLNQIFVLYNYVFLLLVGAYATGHMPIELWTVAIAIYLILWGAK